MPTIEEILIAAKEAGASDVHLTVGIPPKMRVNGNLITMNYPRMLPADTLDVLGFADCNNVVVVFLHPQCGTIQSKCL